MLLPPILVANIGVPMLLLVWPAHWLALLPLTVLQAEIAHRSLQLPRRRALQVAGAAKLISVALGIPLAWAGMWALQVALQFAMGAAQSSSVAAATFPLRCAWLVPTENAWRVYLAFALLAVPCWLVAQLMEFAVARRMLSARPPRAVRSWIVRANLLGYFLVVLAAGVYPVASGGRAW
jgi:hypothetical protein